MLKSDNNCCIFKYDSKWQYGENGMDMCIAEYINSHFFAVMTYNSFCYLVCTRFIALLVSNE